MSRHLLPHLPLHLPLHFVHHDSPVGPLTLIAGAGKLVGCAFANAPIARVVNSDRTFVPLRTCDRGAAPESFALLDRVRDELDAFFARRLRTFSVPLEPPGTEFQRRVWRALGTIPHGQTVSYGHIARSIGAPKAGRAVGAANARNPICILIPCHRVVGASGALTGFGGGLDRKRFLLDLEGAEAGAEVEGQGLGGRPAQTRLSFS